MNEEEVYRVKATEAIIEQLGRIGDALEKANELNAPAAEINAFNLKQLHAQLGQGGLIAAPGALLKNPGR